jgi:hypothetical protein
MTTTNAQHDVPLPPGAVSLGDWRTLDVSLPEYRRMRCLHGRKRTGATDLGGEPIEVYVSGEQTDDGEIDAAIVVCGIEVDPTQARRLAAQILDTADEADGWATAPTT